MAIASIIIGLVLILIAFAAFAFIPDEARLLGIIPLLFGMALLAGGTGVLHNEHTSKEPTALDVYRGNTTLEITYRDSIPIDSTVVFKK